MRKYYGRGHKRDAGAPPLRQPSGTHCQICERDILARNKRGLIAHHGYRRPYAGEQTSSCMGARWQPYEESRSAIPAYMDFVNQMLEQAEAHLDRMKKPGYVWTEAFQKKNADNTIALHTIQYSDSMGEEYYKALQIRIRGQEHTISNMKRELNRCQARYDNWKPVEVRHD